MVQKIDKELKKAVETMRKLLEAYKKLKKGTSPATTTQKTRGITSA